jgi:hypothetical protein
VTLANPQIMLRETCQVLEPASNWKIGREASKQKRSRSEYIELQFETLFFAPRELEN